MNEARRGPQIVSRAVRANMPASDQEFDVIMKKLGDEALGYNIFGVKFPLDVTFANMPSSG